MAVVTVPGVKQMKKRYLIMISLATMVMGTAVYAVVRHERANRPIINRIVNRITRQLDLTDAQQTQVKSILEAERARVGPLLAEAARNRQQLHESTASGKFDEAQVRSLAARQAQTMTEMMVEKERVKARIYNEVLTAEQRTKADQLIERMHARFHSRFHEGAEAVVPIVPVAP
jgi:Spy/CpxP family protein refolding chaperone